MPSVTGGPEQAGVLVDPHRVAAARRLLLEVPGPAAFDRLSALAARLLGAAQAKVTLFPERDVVIGGYGLPEGVIGGPAQLTGAFSAIVVTSGASLALPLTGDDERVAAEPAVTSGQVRSYLGVPLTAASGHVVGVLAVFDEEPQQWYDDEVELLQQLAVSVVAELELSAAQSAVGTSQARLEVALEASSIGIWETDLRTGAILWDERCSAIFGLTGPTHLESFDDLLRGHIHPDDHAAVAEAMATAVAGRGEYLVEARVLRRDGALRWTVSRGRMVVDAHGEPVRVLGTVVDVTEARESAQRRFSAVQRAAAIAEVAAELATAKGVDQLAEVALRGAQVLEAQASALAVFDSLDGSLRLHLIDRLTEVLRDRAGIELPADGVPIPLDDQLPPQYAARHGRRVLLTDAEEALARFPAMARPRALLDVGALAALPLRVEGKVLGSFVVVWRAGRSFSSDDVDMLEALAAQIALAVSRLQADAERAAAVQAMAEANRSLQLLADAGRVLTGTLEIGRQLSELTRLVVPTLGDWCWVVATDEQGRFQEVASAHRDPGRQEEVERYLTAMVAGMSEDASARVVAQTGRSVILPAISDEHLERVLPDPAVRATLARLELGSAVVVPLEAHGQTLGALCLVTAAERGPHTPTDIETAVEIGRRAGLALRHARLYGQQRALSDALQHSMLTEPPQPEHCEIVVRYVPAAEGAEVGGDWYDAFLQPAGATVLAIGDVVGHDTRAAAAMGQVRGLLRGISYSGGGSPAEVLTELDLAVQGLALDTMATALVARLEPDDPRHDAARQDSWLRPGQVLLRWASAGHPPPVVIGPDGQVEELDGAPADLLLGVAPECRREDRSVVLDRGATVLLYTDGLVERRDRTIDEGTEELLAVLAECAALPLAQLCDAVLARLFLPDAEDDVALLAVRLHPEGGAPPVS